MHEKRRKRHGWSLRRKLILFLTGSILLLAALLVFYTTQMIERANQNTRELVESYARKLNNFFSEQLADIIYGGISMSYNSVVQEMFRMRNSGQKAFFYDMGNIWNMNMPSEEQENVIDIIFVGTDGVSFWSKSGRGEKIVKRPESDASIFPILFQASENRCNGRGGCYPALRLHAEQLFPIESPAPFCKPYNRREVITE